MKAGDAIQWRSARKRPGNQYPRNGIIEYLDGNHIFVRHLVSRKLEQYKTVKIKVSQVIKGDERDDV